MSSVFTVVTEHDRKCNRAILDSPVVNRPSTDIGYCQSTLPLPRNHKFEIPSGDTRLVSVNMFFQQSLKSYLTVTVLITFLQEM